MSAEELVEFDYVISDPAGRGWIARACGVERDDGLWEGWLEFEPVGGGDVVRGPRETTQPHRDNLRYWATGLTSTYLEGALDRARRPTPRRAPAAHADVATATPAAAGQSAAAEPAVEASPPRRPQRAAGNSVLDPFAVYAQGEDVLRQELAALSPSHLRHIIRAYDLAGETRTELRSLGHPKLVKLILDGVRSR